MAIEVPHLKLGELLADYEPVHILGTTFTLSLAFFESSVWPNIKTNRLSNLLIIADQMGLQRAFQEAPALKLAGREYVATAAPTTRIFHPKVWLLIEESRALVLVGSGNLTQAGFMKNLELFEAIEISNEKPCSGLFREDVQSFLIGLRSLWSELGPAQELPVVRALEQISSAFRSLPSDLSVSKQCKRRLFHSFQGEFTETLPKIEPNQTLRIASPYFGGSDLGLKRIKEALNAERLAVYPAIHQDGGIDLNVAKNSSGKGVEFLRRKSEDNRFAHLKLISADGAKEKDWIFSGSVNCTDAALSAKNIEAGLWRPLDQKTILSYFVEDREPLPKKRTELVQFDSDKGHGTVQFSAVFNGSSLKLFPAPLQQEIKEVTISVTTSSQEYKAHFQSAFEEQISLTLGPNSFGRPLQFNGSAVVSIEARDDSGDFLIGKAFVEDSTILYGDAGTRRALQYAMMMVESEYMDDSLDCLDDLLNSLDSLEEIALPNEEIDEEVTEPKSANQDKVVLPPIWPPIVLSSLGAGKIATNALGSVHFAQRILSALFSYDSSRLDMTNAQELLPEGEADGHSIPLKSKKADDNWSYIENRFECLNERLFSLEPDAESSKNLWAISATFLLVTLIARRAYRQPAAVLTTILRDFVKNMFAPRTQDSFNRESYRRYKSRIFPTLAADLRTHLNVIPSAEFTTIISCAFAFLLAECRVKRTKFMFVPEFMSFRSCINFTDINLMLDSGRASVIYQRYFSGTDSIVSLSAFTESLSKITSLSWADHPAFSDLAALTGKDVPTMEQVSAYLRPYLNRFLARRASSEAVLALEPGMSFCLVKGCSKNYQITPEKRYLDAGMPIICGGCGTLLVPSDLLTGFKQVRNA